MAGVVGIEPWSFTFGELAEMAYGRQQFAWDQTASLMAMIHNANISKRSQAKSPIDFHPMSRQKKKKLGKAESVSALKVAFCREP